LRTPMYPGVSLCAGALYGSSNPPAVQIRPMSPPRSRASVLLSTHGRDSFR